MVNFLTEVKMQVRGLFSGEFFIEYPHHALIKDSKTSKEGQERGTSV